MEPLGIGIPRKLRILLQWELIPVIDPAKPAKYLMVVDIVPPPLSLKHK